MLPGAVLSQAACGLALFFLPFGAALAGTFAVSPVRVTLSAEQKVASVTVRNTGAEATVVQLELLQWSQHNGRDTYTPTKDLLATPPIFTVPPGGMQVLRLGLRRTPDPGRELTYRVFMQEVPPPPRAGFQGLRVALRIGIPVFVKPPIGTQPALTWRVTSKGAQGLVLSATNGGNAHVQISSIRLRAQGGGQDVATGQVGEYVLSGQTRQFTLKALRDVRPGASLRLEAKTDAGDMQSAVTAERP